MQFWGPILTGLGQFRVKKLLAVVAGYPYAQVMRSIM